VGLEPFSPDPVVPKLAVELVFLREGPRTGDQEDQLFSILQAQTPEPGS
jgi:hypothetical protein